MTSGILAFHAEDAEDVGAHDALLGGLAGGRVPRQRRVTAHHFANIGVPRGAVRVVDEAIVEEADVAGDRGDERPFGRTRHRLEQRQIVADVLAHAAHEEPFVAVQRNQFGGRHLAEVRAEFRAHVGE